VRSSAASESSWSAPVSTAPVGAHAENWSGLGPESLERLSAGAGRVVRCGDDLAVRLQAERGAVRSHPSDSRDRYLLLCFVERGPVAVRLPDGSRIVAESGDAICLTSWRGYRAMWNTPIELVALAVRMDALPECGVTAPGPGGAVQASTAISPQVRAFVSAIADGPGPSNALSEHLLEKMLLEMARAIMLATPGISHIARRSSSSSLYGEAMACIVARRADPDLDPAAVARELNVSLRSLQRAFGRRSVTVSAEIRRQRVELAMSLLQDPHYEVLSVEEIARYTGFTSALLLRRALAAEHQATPREIRARLR
jgi:AraC-like DNA-binding protein